MNHAIGPRLIVFWRQAGSGSQAYHDRRQASKFRNPWISRKALWREAWCSGVVCHLSGKPYFFANVPSDLSLLAFGTAPAREAESAGAVALRRIQWL